MAKQAQIFYFSLNDETRREDKLQWFAEHPFKDIPFENIHPDKNNNWINLADNDWDTLVSLVDKKEKLDNNKKSIFKFSSLGVSTNRDEWVYDYDKKQLDQKICYLIEKYQELRKNNDESFPPIIKWSSSLKSIFNSKSGIGLQHNTKNIILASFRPFIKKYYYSDKALSDRLTANHYHIFGNNLHNPNSLITFGGGLNFFSINTLFDLHFNGDSECFPLYHYSPDGKRIDNITDWGFNQFTKHYGKKGMTKEAIFHYVYAVLHNPAYRTKYELNLKREFPRVPFYDDFALWSAYGEELMDLHINYETVQPFGLQRTTTDTKPSPKPKLKADKTAGSIILDENTTLTGIPAQAWEYKLGNRSALEWILDQYKESKPKDPTIAEHFNTYKFADYKEQVIDLLDRVCRVSVETVRITGLMMAAQA